MPSERARARDDRRLLRRHRRASGSAGPTTSRRPAETIGADRRPDRGADRPRPRLRGGRRRLLPRRAASTATASSRTAPLDEMQQGEDDDRRAAEGGAARTSRSGRRTRRARTRLAVALGRGPAGLAHRVLGDGRGAPRASTSTSTAAAPTWSSRTTRTRSPRPRPRAASRWPGSGCTTAWSSSSGEKMAKSVGNIRLLHEALDAVGRDALIMYFVCGHYRQPLAYTEDALAEAAALGRAACASCARRLDAGRRAPPGPGRRRGALLRRAGRRLQHAARRARRCSTGCARPTAASTPASARRRPRCARCSRVFGLERAAGGRARGAGRRGAAAARASARQARARPRLRAPPTARATSWRRAAGRSATRPRARGCVRRAGDRLRPQPGARGAARAPARSAGSGPPRRGRGSLAARTWTSRRSTTPRRSSGSCGSPDHQGVCAEVGPLPLRRRRLAARSADDALVVCLDEVQDPHNLGAVCRVAEAPAPPGVVIPERRSAEVTPAVCKASAGAVEHLPIARVRNLADWLGDARRPAPGSTAPTRRTACPTPSPTTAAGWCWCWARRGAACARGSPGLRRARLAAAARPGGLAQRLGGGRGAGVRHLAVRAGPLTSHNSHTSRRR